jgi:hypothetical protein
MLPGKEYILLKRNSSASVLGPTIPDCFMTSLEILYSLYIGRKILILKLDFALYQNLM